MRTIRPGMLALIAMPALFFDCHGEDCLKDGPAVDIEVDTGPLSMEIGSLEFDVDLGSGHFKRLYPVGDALAAGRANLRILLGMLGDSPDEMTVTVRGYQAPDGTGTAVAETTQRMPVDPGACN